MDKFVTILRQPRAVSLVLERVFERRYGKDDLCVSNDVRAFQYELVFAIKFSNKEEDFNVMETLVETVNIGTMTTLSTLKFREPEILGIVSDSLTIVKDNYVDGFSQNAPHFIEANLDTIDNRIDLKYFITGSYHNLTVSFKVVTNRKLEIHAIDVAKISIAENAYQFHRNGCTMTDNLCLKVQKGFSLSSIVNQKIPLNDTLYQWQEKIDDFNPLLRPIGSLKRKMPKKKRRPELGNNSILIFMEYIRHPALIIYIDRMVTVGKLKEVIGKCLIQRDYHRPQAGDMKILFNAGIMKDQELLREKLKDFMGARLSMVTSKAFLPMQMVGDAVPENEMQRRTLARLNECYILLRNIHACNMAAKTLMNPDQRTRFNSPVLRVNTIVYSKDLGELIMAIATEVKNLSVNLSKVSNLMVKDENLIQHSQKYNDYKFVVQNTMNAARYCGPLFRSISKFVIPLACPTPRQISILNN